MSTVVFVDCRLDQALPGSLPGAELVPERRVGVPPAYPGPERRRRCAPRLEPRENGLAVVHTCPACGRLSIVPYVPGAGLVAAPPCPCSQTAPAGAAVAALPALSPAAATRALPAFPPAAATRALPAFPPAAATMALPALSSAAAQATLTTPALPAARASARRERSVVIAVSLVLLWLLNLDDVLLTRRALQMGAVEANAVMAQFLRLGFTQAALIKMTVVTAGAIVLWTQRRRTIVLVASVGLASVYLALVVYQLVILSS
jgi:hypothetical protein